MAKTSAGRRSEGLAKGDADLRVLKVVSVPSMSSGERVTDVYCDMNGEPYRADEYGFACLRTKDGLAAPSEFVAPADCWGDVGAASGPLYLALSAIAGIKGYARGNLSLAWASSENGERAAVLMATREVV